VLIDNGPDWQMSDSSRRTCGAGASSRWAPFILEGKAGRCRWAYITAGAGASAAALHWFANVPRCCPNDFRIKSEHKPRPRLAHRLGTWQPWYDKVCRHDYWHLRANAQGGGTVGGRPAVDYPDAADEDIRNGEVWLKGLRWPTNIRKAAGGGCDDLPVDFQRPGPPAIYDGLVPSRL